MNGYELIEGTYCNEQRYNWTVECITTRNKE